MVFCWAVSVYVVLLQCVYFTLGGRVAVFGGVYEAGRVVNVVVGDVSMAIFVCRLLLGCLLFASFTLGYWLPECRVPLFLLLSLAVIS